jgi:hypothetical protein
MASNTNFGTSSCCSFAFVMILASFCIYCSAERSRSSQYLRRRQTFLKTLEQSIPRKDFDMMRGSLLSHFGPVSTTGDPCIIFLRQDGQDIILYQLRETETGCMLISDYVGYSFREQTDE